MSKGLEIRRARRAILEQWGLEDIPFSVRPPTPRSADKLDAVFTGREQELEQALFTLLGSTPRNIFVYGWYGIGKTAFIIQVLHELRTSADDPCDLLTAYISLPEEATDLSSFALIALAQAMSNDDEARLVLDRVMSPTAESSGPPTIIFDKLLYRALDKCERVIIAIDDLDKQDPSRVRAMLLSAQGMLKGDASFILTGHPVGITKDIYTAELGLLDAHIRLDPFDGNTMQTMLANYLNSVRSASAQRNRDDPEALRPFTPTTAQAIIDRSFGIPRYMNRLGEGVLSKAIQLRAEEIDEATFRKGLRYVDEQVRGGLIDPEERYILELVLEKGALSDENITFEELQRLKVREFHEVMPILETLVKRDLLRRLDSERAIQFGPTSLVLPQSGDRQEAHGSYIAQASHGGQATVTIVHTDSRSNAPVGEETNEQQHE